jgi:hypothetical protein
MFETQEGMKRAGLKGSILTIKEREFKKIFPARPSKEAIFDMLEKRNQQPFNHIQVIDDKNNILLLYNNEKRPVAKDTLQTKCPQCKKEMLPELKGCSNCGYLKQKE